MNTIREVSFFVPGVPATKGSTQVIQGKHGRPVVIASNRGKQDTWAGFVASAARKAMCDVTSDDGTITPAIWTGPVAVGCQFVLPARAVTTTAITNGVGDLDKLVRCVWDALTGVVFVDDVQVVAIMAPTLKRIARAELGEQGGCAVTVRRLGLDWLDDDEDGEWSAEQ